MDGKKCAKCDRDASVIIDGVALCSRCAVDSLGDRDEPKDPPADGDRKRLLTRSLSRDGAAPRR